MVALINKQTLVIITVLIAGAIALGTVIPVEAVKGEGVSLLSTSSDNVCGESLCANPMSIQEKIDQYLQELKTKEELSSSKVETLIHDAEGPKIFGFGGSFSIGGIVSTLAIAGPSGSGYDFGDTSQLWIPDWIKDNADWWSQGLISDRDFAVVLGYMLNEKIILVENVKADSEGLIVIDENIHLPIWIKNNAEWWADGLITEEDFLRGIEFLIENGILVI